MLKRSESCLSALCNAGINYEDACALRRISMTLHRWHELECGDGNDYGSWAIVRGYKSRKLHVQTESAPYVTHEATFTHDDDGRPYLEHHHYRHGKGKDSTTYTPLADRERGAIKRLDKIMTRYPSFQRCIQTDPRGCALYILRPEDVPTEKLYRKLPDGSMIRDVDAISSCYTRGIAVFK